MSKAEFVIKRADLAGVELVEADSARAFSRHSHDQFGIGVVLRGAQRSASGQPTTGACRCGVSPGSTIRLRDWRRAGSGIGTAESSAWV